MFLPRRFSDASTRSPTAALVTASAVDVADRARAALTPLLAHDALVLVTPAAAELPVQIAGPRGLSEGLSAIDWRRAVEDGVVPPDGEATRLRLASLDGGLELAGWTATAWCSPAGPRT